MTRSTARRRATAILPLACAALAVAACREGAPAPPTPMATSTLGAAATAGAAPVPEDQLYRAVVQILAQVDGPSGPQTAWHGSGTIVSPDGLVLTNAHVAAPHLPELAAMQDDPSLLDVPVADRLVVALADGDDRLPTPRYRAEVVAVDGILDLAVLRLAGSLSGASALDSEPGLPYAEIGDSDELALGDPVRVLGFPELGGATVTLSRGIVAGFLPQPLVGLRAWVKTDTDISAGSSGGLAVDAQGRLVGIPSQAALAPGGLNLLRPAGFAAPLIEAAASGTAYQSPYRVSRTGRERLTHESWAIELDDEGCAQGEVEAYPPGTSGLAAVFSYRGMADGELLRADWSFGGQRLSSSVWFWDRGPRGACFPLTFHDFGRELDAGAYRLDVRAGEGLAVVGTARTQVQGAIADPETAVYIEGVITDAETGAPIQGAVLLVFREGVSAGAWNRGADRSLDDIVSVAESDRQGRYRLGRALARGRLYEVAADHPEYIQLLGTFDLDETTPTVHTVDIQLNR